MSEPTQHPAMHPEGSFWALQRFATLQLLTHAGVERQYTGYGEEMDALARRLGASRRGDGSLVLAGWFAGWGFAPGAFRTPGVSGRADTPTPPERVQAMATAR
ncbi:MAG: hypothetical protein WD733_25105 [Bryobacterales bacterium]